MRTLKIMTVLLALGSVGEAMAQNKATQNKAKEAKAEAAPAAPAQTAEAQAEEVNVDTIKEKYWARGDESELGVVQNRLYSKSRKVAFGLFGGIVSSDPFLSMKNYGFSAGYHFNEYLALHMVAWKHHVGPSTALVTFEETLGATTNNNPPRHYFGLEGSASILYGKLSLVGKSIIYYDFHLLGGIGSTATESGNYWTPGAGLGQQVYLTKNISLRVDYRLLYYKETIVEKVITPKLGQVIGQRDNWNNTVTFGFDFLWEVK